MTRTAAIDSPPNSAFSPTAFPDYYADERRARRRVRVRTALVWLGVVVGLTGLVEAVRVVSSSQPNG